MRSRNPANDEASEDRKLLLDHRLRVRRLLLDRLLIGLLLVILGFVSSHLLENYKTQSTQSRFFLEKRLGAASDIRAKLGTVTGAYFAASAAPCQGRPINPKEVLALRAALAQFVEALNASALLLSTDYSNSANRVAKVFAGVAAEPMAVPCDSREFVSELADFLTHLTRQQLGLADRITWKGFVPVAMSIEEMNQIGAAEYFRRNLQAWSERRLAESPARSAK